MTRKTMEEDSNGSVPPRPPRQQQPAPRPRRHTLSNSKEEWTLPCLKENPPSDVTTPDLPDCNVATPGRLDSENKTLEQTISNDSGYTGNSSRNASGSDTFGICASTEALHVGEGTSGTLVGSRSHAKSMIKSQSLPTTHSPQTISQSERSMSLRGQATHELWELKKPASSSIDDDAFDENDEDYEKPEEFETYVNTYVTPEQIVDTPPLPQRIPIRSNSTPAPPPRIPKQMLNNGNIKSRSVDSPTDLSNSEPPPRPLRSSLKRQDATCDDI